LIVLVLAGAVLAAGNSVLTLAALKHGSPDFDTQWFHLPFAAAFVQQHSVTALHYVGVADLHQFFPANVELLHALGMLAFGRDVLSMVLNLGFVALALLAAWCLGRPRGAAPATALAAVVVLAVPQILYMSTGSAMDDVPALAFGLAAAALFAHAGSNRAVIFAAACAAGLAGGTKATTIGFAVVLAIGACLVTPRERRRGVAGLWVAGLAAGGGYWYLRNTIAIGNPVPGSVSFLPSPQFDDPWGTLVHQLAQGKLTPSYIAHAFNFAFGPAWWALCALAVLGLVLGLMPSRAGWERAVTAAGIANVLAFALSPFGDLQVNARFLAISLAVGLGMLVTAPAVLLRRASQLAISGVLLVLAVLSVHRYGGLAGRGPLLALALVAVVGVAVVALAERPPARRTILLATPVVVVILLGGSFAAARHYLAHRYRFDTASALTGDVRRVGLKRVFAWAQSLQDQRIGIAGMDLQYPLYGADLSNVVKPVGVPTPHGGLRLPDSCSEWRRAIDAGRFDLVVIAPPDVPDPKPPVEVAWMRSDPSVRTVLQAGGGVTVFRVLRPMDSSTCAQSTGPVASAALA
jgi:hypothetical protein